MYTRINVVYECNTLIASCYEFDDLQCSCMHCIFLQVSQ